MFQATVTTTTLPVTVVWSGVSSITINVTMAPTVSCSSVVVSKHCLYVGSPGSIPTAVTTMTAAGGDAEHVSLNH